MSRTIVLDPAAQSDLDAIYDYLFAHNPAAADRYIRELTERCQVYAQSPFIGQEEREIARYLNSRSHAFALRERDKACPTAVPPCFVIPMAATRLRSRLWNGINTSPGC